jgi:hypothetical protein
MVLGLVSSAAYTPECVKEFSIERREFERHKTSTYADLGLPALMKEQIRRVVFVGCRA